MMIQKKLLSIKDIADLFGTKSSAVCNWRKRDPENFPIPAEETAAGPIWTAEDIVEYINNKFDKTYKAVTSTWNLKIKKIAIMGRARTGKSYFVSRFVYDRVGYVELFCDEGNDKTACPVHTKISLNVDIEYFRFSSNFCTLFREGSVQDELENEEISYLRERVDNFTKVLYPQECTEKMKEIEEVIRRIHALEERIGNTVKTTNAIETFQKANNFCKQLMYATNTDMIEFIDTPGISGKVEAEKVAKSDMYVFMLRSDNSEEFKTLERLIPVVKADIATSSVAFLYSVRGQYPTQEKFDEKAMKKACCGMEHFEDIFSPLRNSIISTDTALAEPAKHCIAFPDMDDEDITDHEKFFMAKMLPRIYSAFTKDDDSISTKNFIEILEQHKDAPDFILHILNAIPQHQLQGGLCPYTESDFSSENHDRVMSNDGYRIHNDLYAAYSAESILLYNYFSKFMPQSFPDEWKRQIIRFIYKRLSKSARNDRGLGIGTHQWEEYPARTMLVEESVFAHEVYQEITGKNEWDRNYNYVKVLKSKGIDSKSWDRVYCKSSSEDAYAGDTKLFLIDSMLCGRTVSSRYEMILVRYIGGLRKLAEYEILDIMGFDKDKRLEELIKMPF